MAMSLWAVMAQAQVIFACEPEWAALARVMLPQAKIHVATRHLQDPHHIEARPALIAQMRAADLAVCSGAGLEEGWLPVLQQRSGNPKIQNGQLGMFWATEGQKLLDSYAGGISPFAGDVHPDGNPHIHTNPERLMKSAQTMAKRMTQLWPDQAQGIRDRARDFEVRWQGHMQRWQSRAQGLKDRTVLSQHTHFAYLWEWLGMKQAADLEPKPGLSPTPTHLQLLLGQVRKLSPPPLGLAVASHQDLRAARFVGQQMPSLSVWVWPATVTEVSEEGLVQWFDLLVADLTAKSS
jgi:zinc/manganese transport system substrate-binding protein